MICCRAKIIVALVAAGFPAMSHAIELKRETLAVWNDYVHKADERMRDRLQASRQFLWTDETTERARRVRRGEVLVAPTEGRGTRDAPFGLIHDWIGAAFIPNVHIGDLVSLLHDYDRYKEVYKPAVTDSKALACTLSDQEFSMTWQHQVLFVNAAVEGRYWAHDILIDEHRGYNIADTVQIREIEGYGQPNERFLAPDNGHGFIWRLHSITRYEERDGGVYFELEAIALTRDIPSSIHWLVAPIVNHLSVNSLTTTLRQTRQAAISMPTLTAHAAPCRYGHVPAGKDTPTVKATGEE